MLFAKKMPDGFCNYMSATHTGMLQNTIIAGIVIFCTVAIHNFMTLGQFLTIKA